jgi:exosortase
MQARPGKLLWTWEHWALAALLAGLGLLVTLPAWADIYRIAYNDEESSHIFLVPVVAAWLAWVRRERLRRCQLKGLWLGPLIVLLGWLISTGGYRNGIQSFWHGGAVMVVVGCFVTVAGRQVLMRFLPAFVVLVFLVPVPGMVRQQLAIPLQTATAHVTQGLFELFGESVERSGNLLSINGQGVAIAEACNGMRMVFALALVSYAFAFGEPLKNHVRLLVLVASPFSAIACNVIRMLPTIWLYGYGSKATADRFHDISGWIMLGAAFLVLMGIIRLLRWSLVPVVHYTLASE